MGPGGLEHPLLIGVLWRRGRHGGRHRASASKLLRHLFYVSQVCRVDDNLVLVAVGEVAENVCGVDGRTPDSLCRSISRNTLGAASSEPTGPCPRRASKTTSRRVISERASVESQFACEAFIRIGMFRALSEKRLSALWVSGQVPRSAYSEHDKASRTLPSVASQAVGTAHERGYDRGLEDRRQDLPRHRRGLRQVTAERVERRRPPAALIGASVSTASRPTTIRWDLLSPKAAWTTVNIAFRISCGISIGEAALRAGVRQAGR
jgi:hypothetical protein